MSCHTPASHTGPEFTAKWEGRLFWELFRLRPGIDAQERAGKPDAPRILAVLAYLLKMNGMPAGPDELPADSTALSRIRIEFKPAPDTSRTRSHMTMPQSGTLRHSILAR